MKSKEEIEQLAEKYYPSYPDGIITDEIKTLREGFIKGYRCQEDIADEKYTEEDIRKVIEVGVNAEVGDYPKGFSYKLGISLEDYFINSLNKQD